LAAHYLAVTLREYLRRDEFSHFILMWKKRARFAVCDGRQKGMNNALDLAKIYIFMRHNRGISHTPAIPTPMHKGGGLERESVYDKKFWRIKYFAYK
jgi:hypothetical protein